MTKEELIEKMEDCRSLMWETGSQIEHFLGSNENAKYGVELRGASRILQSWINGIRNEQL